MTNLRLNLIIFILLVSFLTLQYRLWFESGGVKDMLALKKTLALQNGENDRLRKRNEELMLQIKRLQSSDDATESRARNELGMIKKGETFYQIVKQKG